MHLQHHLKNIIPLFLLSTRQVHAHALPQSQGEDLSIALELFSYASGLATESAFISAALAHTAADELSTISDWGESIASVISERRTISSDYLDPLPSDVRSVYGSIVDAEISIASKAGAIIPIETGSGGGVVGGNEVDSSSVTGGQITRRPSATDYSYVVSRTATGASSGASNTRISIPIIDDNALSTGAKAGIGAGCGVLLLGILAAVWFCMRKRSSKRKNAAEHNEAIAAGLAANSTPNGVGGYGQPPAEKYSEPVSPMTANTGVAYQNSPPQQQQQLGYPPAQQGYQNQNQNYSQQGGQQQNLSPDGQYQQPQQQAYSPQQQYQQGQQQESSRVSEIYTTPPPVQNQHQPGRYELQ